MIMADTPSTPTPAPKTTTKRKRSTINRGHLDELAHSRTVAAAAVNPNYVAGLAGVEFDTTLPAQINTLAGQIDTAIGKLTGTRAGKQEMTAQEKTARDALIAVIAPIQTGAKRKLVGGESKLREAYYIGEALASDTLEEVLTAGKSILARLVPGPNNAPPQDVLPGIKPDPQIKALSDAVALYDTKNTAQGAQQSAAEGTLEAIIAQIATLAGLRHQIQLAADQAWPWRTPGVATIRKDFLLPVDRPLSE
jgi:hypothetical protein